MKTGPTSVDPSELTALRPDHVEQLAMYCTVVDRSVGRLLYLVTNAGAVEGVRAIDVTLGSSDGRRNEMAARAGSLRTALEAGRSAGLPRCRWFDRGCEFRAARVCDCVGDEAAPGDGLLAAVDRLATRPDVERRVRTAIERSSPPIAAPFVDRFRELLYPRRAYFERVGIPAAPPSAAPPPASATADTYGRLVEAVESGPPGEVRSLPSLADEPAEEVGAFQDLPYLLRTSRAWDPVPADRLLDRSPQYALELGFRCAVTGSPRGRVVLAYERAERDEDRIAVFEVRFASLTPFSRLWRSRANALRAALDREDPASLPACPDWMYADCPYRGDCACGAAADRSQR